MASNKSSQLLYKALSGEFLEVENLLLQGLSPNMLIQSGETIFHVVCTVICQLTLNPTEEILTYEYGIGELKNRVTRDDLLPVVELMLKYGAKYDKYHNKYREGTCLHIAARSGDITFVEMFLNSGADIDILNNFNENLLHSALMRDGPDPHNLVEYLIGQGACVHAERKHSKYTPLIIAVSYDHALSVRCLLQHGAKSAACDREGNNSLIYAFTRDAHKYRKKFIYLHLSIKQPLDEVIDLLLLHTSPDELYMRNTYGESVLHVVAKYRYVHAKKLLCHATIDVINMQKRDGYTPFHICFKFCLQRHDLRSVKNIVHTFIEAGALLTMKNQCRLTPLCLFSAYFKVDKLEHEHELVCEILLLLFAAGLNLSQVPKKTRRIVIQFLCKYNKLTFFVAKGFILYCEINSYVQQSLVKWSEVPSLQDLTGRVIRLNMWPNALHRVAKSPKLQ